jgi:hypothetical protein
MSEERRRVEVDGQPLFWDRQGEALWYSEDWSRLFADWEYKRVARDTVGKYLITTVWSGADNSFGGAARPMIFQTGIFDTTTQADHGLGEMVDEFLYATEAEAIAGHASAVTLARALDTSVQVNSSADDARDSD